MQLFVWPTGAVNSRMAGAIQFSPFTLYKTNVAQRLFGRPNGIVRQSDSGPLLASPLEIRPRMFRLDGRNRTSLLTAPFALNRFDREMPTADDTLRAVQATHIWPQSLLPINTSQPQQPQKIIDTGLFLSFWLNWYADPDVADLRADDVLFGSNWFPGKEIVPGNPPVYPGPVDAGPAYRYWVGKLRGIAKGKPVFSYQSGNNVLTRSQMVAIQGGNYTGFPFTHVERTLAYDNGCPILSSSALSGRPTQTLFTTSVPHNLTVGGKVNVRGHLVKYTAGTVSLTTGSSAVVGVGTNWTASVNGWQMYVDGVPKRLKVSTVNSATSITAANDRFGNYPGPNVSNKNYELRPFPNEGIYDRQYVVVEAPSATTFVVEREFVFPGAGGHCFPSGLVQSATEDGPNTNIDLGADHTLFSVGDFLQLQPGFSSTDPSQNGRVVWSVVAKGPGTSQVTIDRPSTSGLPAVGSSWSRSAVMGNLNAPIQMRLFKNPTSSPVPNAISMANVGPLVGQPFSFAAANNPVTLNDLSIDFRSLPARDLFMRDLLRAVRFHATFGVDGVLLDELAHHSLSAPGVIEDWTTVTAPRLAAFRQALANELRMRLGANITWQYADEDYTQQVDPATGQKAPQLEALLRAVDAVWMEGGYVFHKRRNYPDSNPPSDPNKYPDTYLKKKHNKWYLETLTYLLNRGLTMMFVSIDTPTNVAITNSQTPNNQSGPVTFTAKGHGLRVGDQVGIYGYSAPSASYNRVAEVTVVNKDDFTVNFNGGGNNPLPAWLAYSRLKRTIGVLSAGAGSDVTVTKLVTGRNIYMTDGTIVPPGTSPDLSDAKHYAVNPPNANRFFSASYPQFLSRYSLYGFGQTALSNEFVNQDYPPPANYTNTVQVFDFVVGSPASGIVIDLFSDKRQFASIFMVLRNLGHRGFVDWATSDDHGEEQWQTWPMDAGPPAGSYTASYDNIDNTSPTDGHCIKVEKIFLNGKTAILWPQKTWGELP